MLLEQLKTQFPQNLITSGADNVAIMEVNATDLIQVATALKEDSIFQFQMLIDLCGIDFLHYGLSEWRTEEATATGFSRGKQTGMDKTFERSWDKPRFCIAYQLLSFRFNQRMRLKVFVDDGDSIPSVISIWPCADWYEREAFDLYGIFFEGHPDLRRLLTDYGFIGHPFRKDFPLIGEVEMRYDAAQQRCVYEPVSIRNRVTVPKVIRKDQRYATDDVEEKK